MFITFEGIEGSGKTTQIGKVVERLGKMGYDCMVTREPGDTPIGKKIRRILLDPENRNLVPLAELFLYAADRAQHLEERILPALSGGKVVLCDRFADAGTVYQGVARGIGGELVGRVNKMVLGNLVPDLTLLFDLPVEEGLARARRELAQGGRSPLETRFENEALAFHNKVREGYLALYRENPNRFRRVDARGSVGAVNRRVMEILGDFLTARRGAPMKP